MRVCRIQLPDSVRYGVVDDGEVELWMGAPWGGGVSTSDRMPLTSGRLLCPVEPSKIVCIGRNYRAHIEELGHQVPAEPLIFLKPPTALNGPGQPIRLPRASRQVEHEAELALVIGERLSGASEASAARAIFGLTCFNDVTARDIQRKEVQFTRAKGYDTFACVGPWVQTELSPADLRIVCRVKGQVRQDGRTSAMMVSPALLLAFISEVMTLLPGDLVTTGTPQGVGRLSEGDVVEVEIEGIGTLRNPVEMAT